MLFYVNCPFAVILLYYINFPFTLTLKIYIFLLFFLLYYSKILQMLFGISQIINQ